MPDALLILACISSILTLPDWAYDQWAIRRLQITGRPDLEVILKQRQEELKKKDFSCDDEGECEIDWDKL